MMLKPYLASIGCIFALLYAAVFRDWYGLGLALCLWGYLWVWLLRKVKND